MSSFDLSLMSKREMQVFELLAAGHRARAVGEMLFISCKTAESHKARIKAKFGITTPVEWMSLLRQIQAPSWENT